MNIRQNFMDCHAEYKAVLFVHCRKHRRMSNIPGLCPVDASNALPHQALWQLKTPLQISKIFP